ncbi:MAG: hypothetical protein ABIY55_09075 [Kofleriaceae bacterium]
MRQIVPRPGRSFAALALALAVTLGAPSAASARSEKTLAYPREQVWPAAVRFLVVDEHLKITEKDADAGFVTFELHEDHKTFRGALEVVTLVRDGRTVVRFVLSIDDRPSWIEIAMLTRLETKLRAELGAPTPAPAEPPKKDEPPRKDEAPKKGAPKPDDGAKPDDHGPTISPTP